MSYNFYDFNNALQQRNEYVEDRLRDGSPVIALSYPGGILMLTLRHTQRKVYEIYDRLIMGAIGKQSDIESVRLAAIDTAHREGFQRSEDDVSIQRLVGFGLSPAVKRIYNDNTTIPLTFRGIFAEVDVISPEEDQYFTLGYDGEFRTSRHHAVAAGTLHAVEQAEASLKEVTAGDLTAALGATLHAWGIAHTQLAPFPEKIDEDGEEVTPPPTPSETVKTALAEGLSVEAAILERHTKREIRFRLLTATDLDAALVEYRPLPMGA